MSFLPMIAARSMATPLVWMFGLILAASHPVAVTGQDDFPELPNTEPTDDATRLSPAEAARRMTMPAGFEVDVFAAEPDVQNPIALTWDGQGRLWVAENYTYADRTQQFDLSLRDRVLILEDRDGDGKCDGRTVFTDNVQMLTGIEVGWGGVWVMCPPKLLFIPDANRDDRPDGPAQVVLDGFEVARANYHNFANGLRFGPDGWLYGRCGGSCPGRIGKPGTPDQQRYALEGGIWRYHPGTQRCEVLVAGTTNPWGHDWNALGELFFINTVNGHFWHMIPGAHYMRPFTLDPNPAVYEMLDQHADHWHFDTGQGWTASRDGAANDYGGGHAHVGGMIYQGTNWPERYRGNFFTFNIHGRRANQELIQRAGSGFVAKHGDDIALSQDVWFRGMELTYGPDGAVLMADWSDAGECHEHTGVHRTSGRIYRVVYRGDSPNQPTQQIVPDLGNTNGSELVELIASSNEWFSRRARIELAYRAWNADPVERDKLRVTLQHQLANAETTSARLRYLWALHAMDGLKPEFLRAMLKDADEAIRAWSIRLISDGWPIDDVMAQLPIAESRQLDLLKQVEPWGDTFCQVADQDASGLVLLTLASTLQRMPIEQRVALAHRLVQREEFSHDHNLPLIVWYGLMRVANESPARLFPVLRDCRWPKTQRFIARRVAEMWDERPELASQLVTMIVDTDSAKEQENLLRGVQQGLEGWRSASAPAQWPQLVARIDDNSTSTSQQIVRSLGVLFGDGRALEEVRSIVLDDRRDVNERRSALAALVEQRPTDLAEFCLPLLRDPRLNMTAARGLAQVNNIQAADALIQSYRYFRAPNRPRVIAILVSREVFATRLLDALEANQLAASEVSAFDVRQLHSLQSPELSKRISQLWGEVRETDANRQQSIDLLTREISTSRENQLPVNLSEGRRLFQKNCANCHRLFGDGQQVGPDLTGSNRDSLDYLLQNIVDPSAVVSNDYRMSTITTNDGRVLNGLVLVDNEKTISLQTQTERITLDRKDVDDISTTRQSPMPEGLLTPLTHQQRLDLIAYLQSSTQVDLPADE